MPKHESNTELVTRLMEFSSYGGMSQLVIMTAIEKYTDLILKMGLEGTKEAFEGNDMINGEAWYKTAKAISDELKKR